MFKASIQAPEPSDGNEWFILKYRINETYDPNSDDRVGAASLGKKRYQFNLLDRHYMVLSMLEKGVGEGDGAGTFEDLRYLMASKVQLAWKSTAEEENTTTVKGPDNVLAQLLLLSQQLRIYKRVQTLLSKGQSRVILIVEGKTKAVAHSSDENPQDYDASESGLLASPLQLTGAVLNEPAGGEALSLMGSLAGTPHPLTVAEKSQNHRGRINNGRLSRCEEQVCRFGPKEYPHMTMVLPPNYPSYAKPYRVEGHAWSRSLITNKKEPPINSKAHLFRSSSELRDPIMATLDQSISLRDSESHRSSWTLLPGFSFMVDSQEAPVEPASAAAAPLPASGSLQWELNEYKSQHKRASFTSQPLEAVKELALNQNGLLLTFETRLDAGHADSITQVVFSIDESRVASASHDGTIKLWDPDTGRMVCVLRGHKGVGNGAAIHGVCFSNDGFHLLSCGADRQIILWSTITADQIKCLHSHDNIVSRCHFFRNANQMVSCSHDATIKHWSLTPDVPAKVKGLSVLNTTANTVELAWTAPPAFNNDITAYRLSYRTNTDPDKETDFMVEYGLSGTTLQHVVQSLSPGTAYQFRVRAVNDVGEGEWSNISSEIITNVGLPERLDPRPTVVDRSPVSITLLWRSPCDMNKVAYTRYFSIQCEGSNISFTDEEDKGMTLTVRWDDAMQAAYCLSQKYSNARANLKDLLFPAEACARKKQHESRQANAKQAKDRDQKGVCLRRMIDVNTTSGRSDKIGVPLSPGHQNVFSVIMGAMKDKLWGRRNKTLPVIPELKSIVRQSSRIPTCVEDPANEVEILKENQALLLTVSSAAVDATDDNQQKLGRALLTSKDIGGTGVSFERLPYSGDTSVNDKTEAKPSESISPFRSPSHNAPLPIPSLADVENVISRATSGERSPDTVVKGKKQASSMQGKDRTGQVEDPGPSGICKVEETDEKGRRCMYMVATFPGLKPGEVYRFRVAAVNSAGRGVYSDPSYSVSTLCAAPDKPQPPTLLQANLRSLVLELVHPKANGAAISGWNLWLDHAMLSRKLKKYQTRYEVEALEPGKEYTFKVQAVNALGPGPWSDVSSPLRTSVAAPGVPISPQIKGHKISQTCADVDLEIPPDNGSPVTWLVLQRRQLNNFEKTRWGNDIRIEVDSMDWEKHCRTAGVLKRENSLAERLQVAVLASTSGGSGITSTKVVPGATGGTRRSPEPVLKKGQPQITSSKSLTPRGGIQQLDVALEQPSRICYTSTYLITGLKPATVYDFRIAAGNSEGLSGWSEPSKKVKTLTSCPPLAPASPQIAQVSTTSVLLTWIEPDGNGSSVMSYKIEVFQHTLTPTECCSKTRGKMPEKGPKDHMTLLFTLDHEEEKRERRVRGLEPKGYYSFRVAGVNSKGVGAFSNHSAIVSLPSAAVEGAANASSGHPSRPRPIPGHPHLPARTTAKIL